VVIVLALTLILGQVIGALAFAMAAVPVLGRVMADFGSGTMIVLQFVDLDRLWHVHGVALVGPHPRETDDEAAGDRRAGTRSRPEAGRSSAISSGSSTCCPRSFT
jgi:hypothetical protein